MHIEGRNAVIEAIKADMPIERILMAQRIKSDRSIEYLLKTANEKQIPCEEVTRHELDNLSERGVHQGVIAVTPPYPFGTLDAVVAATHDAQNALVILLDHITDPGNLGAIVRSAEVVGAAGVIIPERRSVGVTPAAWKAAAGALAHIPLVQVTNVAQTIERLQKENFWVAGASEHATQVAWDAPLAGRLVLVMGSEGEGLARLTQQRCDFLVKLPQAGKVGSLNVVQACTALSYEWLKQSLSTLGRV